MLQALRYRFRWRHVLIAVVIFATASVCATILIFRGESARVERMRADIRSRGEPVTSAELDAFYPRPKAEVDATDLWVTAIAEVERTIQLPHSGKYSKVPIQGTAESAGYTIPLPGQRWDDLALTQQYLVDVSASMKALHAAADFGGRTRYPGSISNMGAHLTRVQTLRDANRRLHLEAYVRAHENDAAGTADSLHAALALVQSMRDEPTTTAMLFRFANHGMPVSLLIRVLAHVEFDERDLATLQKELEAIEFKEQLRRATCGDRALGLILFDNLSAGGLISDPKGLPYRITRPLDEATYIAMMNDWVALVGKSWIDILASEEAIAAKWDTQRSPLHMLSNMMSDVGGMGIEAAARSEALNRFAIVAVALERMRRATGQLPQHVQDLVPDFVSALPDDPFTGLPFCYETKDSRYVLYSKSHRDPTRMAIRTAKVFQIDPATLLRDAEEKARVPPGSIWDLPTETYPYLLFRWPPLPEAPHD